VKTRSVGTNVFCVLAFFAPNVASSCDPNRAVTTVGRTSSAHPLIIMPPTPAPMLDLWITHRSVHIPATRSAADSKQVLYLRISRSTPLTLLVSIPDPSAQEGKPFIPSKRSKARTSWRNILLGTSEPRMVMYILDSDCETSLLRKSPSGLPSLL